jgi:rhodanese-related sulfurtransferase
MEIGLFQLENLFLTPTRFCFLDIRLKPVESAGLVVDKLVSKAQRVPPQAVLEHLVLNKVEMSFPLVLLCADGKTSAKVARKLESAGYGNVYVVTRGIVGLLSEL